MTERAMIGNGSAGDEVTALQQGLAGLGFDPGAVDGVFGAQTEAAAKAFQSANGLDADGVVGPATWAALDAAVAAAAAASATEAASVAAAEAAPVAAPEATPAPEATAPVSSDPSGIGGVLDALKEQKPVEQANLGAL